MMKSEELFRDAEKLIPGGVNSPVRAFKSVGTFPRFIARGEGCFLFDVDGKRYIDYVGSWGPLILGHRHPAVIQAIRTALDQGTSFGAPTEREVEMAKLVTDCVPAIEMIRMVNSGTEATMSALRLARGATGRRGIIKFDGCYHGHADALLVKAGSGLMTLGIPGCLGVPDETVRHTHVGRYNDLGSVQRIFEQVPNDIAAIIVEPVAGNMGVVPPLPGFLEGLRELADRHRSLLIFDEVMTGFRVALGGAQERFDITPDLTCLGKIIGGGLPVGAYGGRRDLMRHIAPSGHVYQAGTLSGNPLAMAAGIATLTVLRNDDPYPTLERRSAALGDGLAASAKRYGVPHQICRVGSMLTLFFSESPITDDLSSAQSNTERFGIFFRRMLEAGVYIPASQFEAWFVSTAHDDAAIEATLEAADRAFVDLTR